jgi:WD40 repeat protein
MKNPYVGARAIQKGEALYGRDREVEELLDLLMAERIVLLYSPSGAGKTSLLQAGLLPRLEDERFQPLPILRVSRRPAHAVQQVGRVANRYILSLLLYMEDDLPPGTDKLPLEKLAGMTLAEYLKHRCEPTDDDACHQILIFDQFEEILTVHASSPLSSPDIAAESADGRESMFDADQEAKRAFFHQVGAALRNRRRWALFAMREDNVAALDPYLAAVPTRLGNTYRLNLLDRAKALQAARGPASLQGVEFAPDAAEKLIDDLRLIRVKGPAGMAKVPGPYVEPVQLQVVCFTLWEKLHPEQGRTITVGDLDVLGDVDNALMGYYDNSVRAVAARPGVREREVRDWFDRYLITAHGRRSQVLQGDRSQTVPDEVVADLVDAHLIREERRAGSTWFELAHDRLIDPVRKSNDAWSKSLPPLQRMAPIWDGQDRPPDNFLLRHQELEDAETWAAQHADDMNDLDRAFLKASREHRERGEQKRNLEKLRSYRRLGVVAVGVIVCLISLFTWALIASLQARRHAQDVENKKRELEVERDRAKRLLDVISSERMAEEALMKINADAELSVLLCLKALKQLEEALQLSAFAGEVSTDTHDIEQAQRKVQSALNLAAQGLRLKLMLSGHTAGVNAVAFSPDGARIATASDDQQAKVWDAGSGETLYTLNPESGNVNSVAFSPDGKLLATAGENGCVVIWDLKTGEVAARQECGAEALAVAYSPSGTRLAAALADSTATVWDLSVALPKMKVLFRLERHTAKINAIAFDPKEKWLATASDDKTAKLWNANTGALIRTLGGSPSGHTEAVNALAFNSEGTQLATASEDMTGRVWNVDTGELIWTLSGHTGPVRGVAFSSDGKRLATASRDMHVKVWDAETGESPFTLSGHHDMVTGVAFHPRDLQRLATSSDDTTVRIWDLAARPELHPLGGAAATHIALNPDGAMVAEGNATGQAKVREVATGKELAAAQPGHLLTGRCVAFGPDGRRLLTGSQDGTAELWDAASGKELLSLSGHMKAVLDVAFSPDGETLATVSLDGTARLWNAASGKEVLRLAEHLWPRTGAPVLAFSPSGKHLATASAGQAIRVWDVAAGKETYHLARSSYPVSSLAFSADDKLLLAGFSNGTAGVWDIASPPGKELHRLSGFRIDDVWLPPDHVWGMVSTFRPRTGHAGGGVSCAAFSPDGTKVVTGGWWDRTVRIWDAATGAELAVFRGHRQPVSAVAFAPGGARVASASADGTARLWDAVTGKELLPLTGHTDPVSRVTFSADGTRLATGGEDHSIRVWDAATGTRIQLLRSQASKVDALAVSPDGKSFAVARADKTIAVFDIPSGKQRRILPDGLTEFFLPTTSVLGSPLAGFALQGHKLPISSLAYSPGAERLVSGSLDKTAKIWRVDSGQLLHTLAGNKGHTGVVFAVAFSPSGQFVATGGYDRTVKLWYAATGEHVLDLAGKRGHANSVYTVAFSPDGKLLASGSQDGTAKLWNLAEENADKRFLHTLSGHNGVVRAVAFSPGPEGKWLATASDDNTVKVWDITSGKEFFTFSHPTCVWSLAFSPDGKHLVTVSANKTVCVYNLDLEELKQLAHDRVSPQRQREMQGVEPDKALCEP